MLDRLTRVQLAIFAVVTVITVVIMAIFYLRLPAAMGLGTYRVTADFVAGGGLYKNANVTYRGVAVGRVDSVGLTSDGVNAVMRLNSGTSVPSNVTASVKSVSAIGEQYIDLVPPAHAATTKLHNGSRIDRANTAISVDIATLLHQSETLVNSVADTRLRELLHETFKAFNGSGPELARLLESSRLLVDKANADFPQTSQLIDQVGPFLQSQIRSGNDIRALSDGLARFTSEVRQADPQLRTLLTVVPPAVDQANTAFSGIRPSFPLLAANLANLGRVGVIYHKSIEQLLVVLPALFAAIITSANGEPQDEGAKLDFKINIDPPPCNTGFIPPPMIRTPADETLREIPTDMYCKTAHNDPSTVRGARNYPCQEFPGKRAPTVALCRDPKGYVPIGTNPWRGPPIPYDTPMTNGLNILPPNKYPYIPPGNDPDPGTAYAPGFVPPGVIEGPGPAPHQPFPTPPPPNTGGTDGRQAWIPPAPYPPQNPQIPFPKAVPAPPPPLGQPGAQYPPPEKPWGPPPGPVPQANGTGYTTYDESTGEFVDPSGVTGIFAAGKMSSAENWVDLMSDPRQT
ncbi:MAG TPA: MCE family protein [Mycobacterium sp.]|jgi:phospholipid/cholesterol/gamma-HCH transport system substrate-binding protein|nr:MCE family protein [Mycobacterium sp.]